MLHGLTGVHAAPPLQARLIELARVRGERSYSAWSALKHLQNKGPDTVRFLVDGLASPDPQVAGSAFFGLGFGVAPEDQPVVADAVVEHFEERAHPHERDGCLRLIHRFGVERHVDALERFAGNELLPAATRDSARRAAGLLRERLER